MRVAIDTRWVFREISGIGAHTRQLVRHLALLDQSTEYLLLFNDPDLRDRTLADCGLSGCANVTAALVPWKVFSPAGQLFMPDWLRRQRVDVFHSPNYMMPLLAFPRGRPGRIKAVVTIHDLIPLVAPAATPRALKRRLFPLYRRLMHEIGARADRIIAVSEVSRRDVLEHLGIADPARVRVIYNGVDAMFRPSAEAERVTPPASSDWPRVILYVGRSDPYKNLAGLVRAFAEARRLTQVPLRLRIVGPRDPRYPEPAALVEQLHLSDAVDWTGYVADADLVQAYRDADVLVLPSHFEGFGFPVVEAMACATPVVCSDIPVLHEVAGEAAGFANPDDPAALARAIVRVLTDEDHRRAMIARGRAQATRFTWERAARDTLALYRETAIL
jgi:glycosyltransferase involved in cell wall biosynthesis